MRSALNRPILGLWVKIGLHCTHAIDSLTHQPIAVCVTDSDGLMGQWINFWMGIHYSVGLCWPTCHYTTLPLDGVEPDRRWRRRTTDGVVTTHGVDELVVGGHPGASATSTHRWAAGPTVRVWAVAFYCAQTSRTVTTTNSKQPNNRTVHAVLSGLPESTIAPLIRMQRRDSLSVSPYMTISLLHSETSIGYLYNIGSVTNCVF